jgi:hypothetical protein
MILMARGLSADGYDLTIAIYENNLNQVKAQIKRGTSFKAADYSGETPLWNAAFVGREEIFHYLIEQGAPYDVPQQGQYALLAAVQGAQGLMYGGTETKRGTAAKIDNAAKVRIANWLLKNTKSFATNKITAETITTVAVAMIVSSSSEAPLSSDEAYAFLKAMKVKGAIMSSASPHSWVKGSVVLRVAAANCDAEFVADLLSEKGLKIQDQIEPFEKAASCKNESIPMAILRAGFDPGKVPGNQEFDGVHVAAGKGHLKQVMCYSLLS